MLAESRINVPSPPRRRFLPTGESAANSLICFIRPCAAELFRFVNSALRFLRSRMRSIVACRRA